MADDVEEFIEQHSLHLPTLIGHSMSVSMLCMTLLIKAESKKGAQKSP